jgi:hypothetical protein
VKVELQYGSLTHDSFNASNGMNETNENYLNANFKTFIRRYFLSYI